MEMDRLAGRIAHESVTCSSAAPDPVADVGRALRWPAVLEEDLTVGVSEHDAGLVPDGVDGLPGPLLADLELDAVQVDIAVGLDLQLPAALTSNAGRPP